MYFFFVYCFNVQLCGLQILNIKTVFLLHSLWKKRNKRMWDKVQTSYIPLDFLKRGKQRPHFHASGQKYIASVLWDTTIENEWERKLSLTARVLLGPLFWVGTAAFLWEINTTFRTTRKLERAVVKLCECVQCWLFWRVSYKRFYSLEVWKKN